VWADLLMANLTQIRPGTDRITLPDFYTENHLIEIKLKKDLSPQKNAEIYYKKSKKQQSEIDRLQQTLASKEKDIVDTKDHLAKLASITELKNLRSFVHAIGLSTIKKDSVEILPFHTFEYNGFKILVGKNAQSNDTLILTFGYKEDLWLHAKDVAGSHVLIKYQSGKKFPKDVIERAAQLAAYHSKRKTDSLCPVIVTPRKFVRKRKGDPAGSVIVAREEVILVEPKR
jgi:predicted ribosome quality control (RQC) complex YloA/Tae2 family protein